MHIEIFSETHNEHVEIDVDPKNGEVRHATCEGITTNLNKTERLEALRCWKSTPPHRRLLEQLFEEYQPKVGDEVVLFVAGTPRVSNPQSAHPYRTTITAVGEGVIIVDGGKAVMRNQPHFRRVLPVEEARRVRTMDLLEIGCLNPTTQAQIDAI